MGTKVHFFSGSHCVSFDRTLDQAFFSDDEAPSALIVHRWPGLAAVGFGANIDAVLNWGDGKLYFFRGPDYLRFDIKSRAVDPGYPLKIADHWPGMAAAGFGSDLDAAVNWGNGKVFFFKGPSYVRYDMAADKVDDGYPLSIAEFWPGFAAAGFGANIEAVVPWGDGKAYVFSGNRYLRYDMLDDRTDDGYPLIIGDRWAGMTDAGLAAGLRGGCDFAGGLDVWLPGAQIIPCPVGGHKFTGAPWRGVLHTTEGGNIASNVATYLASGNDFPHFTIDPAAMAVAQHFALNGASRALEENAGPTNALNAIQIEICGRAAEAPNWPPEFLAFIQSVMLQIEELVPIPHSSGLTFINAPAGPAADAANRLSQDAWRRFSGWCGHQHVPGNSHQDPGGIDIAFLVGDFTA